jgi:hypothetical protein
LIIDDGYVFAGNSRILIYNHIPTSNNASADVVVGQADMTGGDPNQGGAVGANTLNMTGAVYSDGTRLFVSDALNSRILIYNHIPTSNNASADVVVGQEDMTSSDPNQGGSVQANTLNWPSGMLVYNSKFYLSDSNNNRILIYKLLPILSEVGSIGTTEDTTPDYTFSSDEAGIITYGGDCFGSTTTAISGDNTITFNSLPVGAHNNCTITVTDGAGFASSPLSITPFTVSSAVLADNLSDTNITTNTPIIRYSKKSSANKKITFTIWGKHIYPKAKSKYFSLKLNGKRARVVRARNRGNNLQVTVDLKYGRWKRGSYNLTLSYKNFVNKRWHKESFSKDNILNIN